MERLRFGEVRNTFSLMKTILGLISLIVFLPPLWAQDVGPVARQLESFFDDPAFVRALWGVKVQSADTGEVLYERNSHKFFMPASNMKLLTAVAAVEKLGLDFNFETEVMASGEIRDGTLQGDLVIVGSGDPTLGARLSSADLEALEDGDPLAVFRDWSRQLKELGIERIEGALIGDDSVFDAVGLGMGWSWDDLPFGFSAEISGLSFNENAVLLKIEPGEEPGQQPVVTMIPETAYLQVENELLSVPEYEEWEFSLQRLGDANQVRLRGTVPAVSDPLWRTVAVEDPTSFFLAVLKETLEAEGIAVAGGVHPAGSGGESTASSRRRLFVHQSPDLRWILRVLLKISQNLYADTLVRLLDRHPVGKSYVEGRKAVQEVLTRIGVPSDSYVLADGSGLSRYSYVTPDALVRILRYVHRAPYREEFVDTLPVAGVDGSIRRRMRGTPAYGNVRAKTGTLSNVRSLSGYVTTKDEETLAFSMIVNHYAQPRRSAEYLQDLTLEFLASLSLGHREDGGLRD